MCRYITVLIACLRKIAIFLPESFEWLILSAGVIKEVDIDRIENTFMYADSNKFFSWEQYFTFLLEEVTKNDKVRKYSKKDFHHTIDRIELQARLPEL